MDRQCAWGSWKDGVHRGGEGERLLERIGARGKGSHQVVVPWSKC